LQRGAGADRAVSLRLANDATHGAHRFHRVLPDRRLR
jgi:hypothetical protein